MQRRVVFISIHAPREGGDLTFWVVAGLDINFNPRPPARGATFHRHRLQNTVSEFQSTPPARGATTKRSVSTTTTPNFNPRPPRGGRPFSDWRIIPL